ncbi:MAG: hypothetical protein LBQ66_04655 [Planctomycetaceae bacterium]|nr:hypothetical protein [Planctomycetaceae bacterium]
MAFSSNFFGSITHRGGRDARVPVLRRFAAIVGCPPYVVVLRMVAYLTISNVFYFFLIATRFRFPVKFGKVGSITCLFKSAPTTTVSTG